MGELSGPYRRRAKDGRKLIFAHRSGTAQSVAAALVLALLACQPGPATEAESPVASGGDAKPPGEDQVKDGFMVIQPPESSAASGEQGTPSGPVEQLKVKVVGVYPHDPGAFTQGLVWDGGLLYESTGLYGKSSLRRVEPFTGEVLERRLVDPNLFGEGLALVGDRLLQLTWKAGIVLVYDLANLELVDEYGFNGEGWGLAYDGRRLVMSDGTSRLTFRDLDDFRWQATLEVRLTGNPVVHLNELELAEGALYANVWGRERIVRLDPETGVVDAVIDASGLLSREERARVDVLNGIAYDPVSKTFWLTGKFWPKMFQVVFVPRADR